jgi:predicted membrane protein DUF2207
MTMVPTLAARRDRAGHIARVAALALLAGLLAPTPAAGDGPGAYLARRFDVQVKALPGGSLDVTEAITFEFRSGTFRNVWREIPESRTDGVEIVEARMDGGILTRGEGPGHIEVSRRNRVRVEWRFAPAGPSTHRFELHYIARGVVYRGGTADVVRWRLLPAEHRYRIAESASTITAPAAPARPPSVESRRAGGVTTRRSANAVQIAATAIATNGWVMAEIHYPAGSLTTTSPEWQRRQDAATALAPRWQMAAAGIFVGAFLLLLIIRQGYDSPGFEGVERATVTEPPAALPVALAAALATKGRSAGYPSLATLLDLADRRVLTVRELPRKFGVRNYELSQVAGKHDLDDHEMEALSIAFAGGGDEVTISRASGRLARASRRFSKAVNAELAGRGLLDPARKAVRDRLTAVSLGMVFTAGLGAVGLAALIPRYGGWPLLMPLALVICGLVGVVMAAATSPLSDAGLMEAARWRGFKVHLKEIATARDADGGQAVPPRWTLYAVALGLSYHWSRYLKKHPDIAPAWFVAAGDNPGSAFAAFVGSHAATGAGAAGGGAAGGGGSGAG